MKTKEIIEVARELAKPFRVSKGKDFGLKDVDPNDTLEFTKKADLPIDEAGLNAWVERHSSDPLQAARAWVAQYKERHRKDRGG